jgi:hypothetical protein
MSGIPVQHCSQRSHGVDDELLAIAAPPLPDKNYELNSDAGGLRALHPRAQDIGTILQRLIDSQLIDRTRRCLHAAG